MNQQTFGEYVATHRSAAGLSLRELGERVGRSASAVRNWEQGKNVPTQPDVLGALAEALQVPEEVLRSLAGVEAPESPEPAPPGEAEVEEPGSVEVSGVEGPEVSAPPPAAPPAAPPDEAPDESELPLEVQPESVEVAGVEGPEASAAPPAAPLAAPPDEAPDESEPPLEVQPESVEVAGVEGPEASAAPPAAPPDESEPPLEVQPESVEVVSAPEAPAARPWTPRVLSPGEEPSPGEDSVPAGPADEPPVPPWTGLPPQEEVSDSITYLIRGVMTAVGLILLLVVLVWAVGSLFDQVGGLFGE